MLICRDKSSVRAARARLHGRVAFVPTMGALHAGHLALVAHAQAVADATVVSIFVNPTQFDDDSEYARYPRDLDADVAKLRQADVDAVFVPVANHMYTDDATTTVTVPAIGDRLCGIYRARHFDGVATVVTKLLNIVTPDIAIFGEKDYQQLLVIRTLARDLDLPVTIIGHPTVREPDGLAMSSRNRLLNDTARTRAPQLYRELCGIQQRLYAGETNTKQLAHDAFTRLTDAGFAVDYVHIGDAVTLRPLDDVPQGRILVCVAATIDGIRLIDNICLDMDAVQSNIDMVVATERAV